MHVRPYIIPTTTRLQTIKVYFETAINQWSDEWGLGSDFIVVKDIYGLAELGRKDYQNPDLLFYADEKAWISCSADWDFYRALGAKLIAGNSNTNSLSFRRPSIAFDIVVDSMGGLIEKLSGFPFEVIVDNAAEYYLDKINRDEINHIGSGAVCVSLEIGSSYLYLYFLQQSLPINFEEQQSDQQSYDDRELASMKNSILDEVVCGNVVLGSSEVNVDALSSLQIGDVIYLDKPLDEPLCIKFSSGVTCNGYVGKKDKHFAIQIDSLV